MKSKSACAATPVKRRDTLRAFIALGLALPLTRARSADDAANAAPSVDDILVYAYGERAGQPLAHADVELGARQILAYPMDPAQGIVRDGTRLNQLLVTRLAPSQLTEQTLARSAEGVVAYSAVCTHTGCDVTEWDAAQRRFQCPCHDSQFDAGDGARVVGGPAPRPLPSLPLKLVGGVLTIAGGFDAPVGFQQPGLDPFGF